jgi:molecular chaperone GrpE
MKQKKNENEKDNARDLEEILDDAIGEVEGNESEDRETMEEITEEERLKEELEKEKDKFLRLFAEFENYKRRTGKERMELFKTANQEVLESMLPVLDDFDRALNEIKKSGDNELLKGVELISDKLRKTLKNKGLEQMQVKQGDDFDADLHEAVTQIPAPEKKLKGKIVDVVEKGYTLGDRIIRYPKVVTGN